MIQNWEKLEAGRHQKGGVSENGQERGFRRYILQKLTSEYLRQSKGT